mmetsp:Transcript_33933/g.93187  ORF Transcript_33933/g.93187 Transcript_33933/m.93187 type:complete len:259 (+) Transcript_33933:600-1376(+)
MMPERRPGATGAYREPGSSATCFSCVRSTRAGLSSTSSSGCGSSAPSGSGGLCAISSTYTTVLTSPRLCATLSLPTSSPTDTDAASTSIVSLPAAGAAPPLSSALMAAVRSPFFSSSPSVLSIPSTAALSAAACSAAACSAAAFSAAAFSAAALSAATLSAASFSARRAALRADAAASASFRYAAARALTLRRIVHTRHCLPRLVARMVACFSWSEPLVAAAGMWTGSPAWCIYISGRCNATSPPAPTCCTSTSSSVE